jgi:type I restriction enzyme, R subunit
VLAYIACAVSLLNRAQIAAKAKELIRTKFSSKQQAFLDFVLSHYVSEGVEGLVQDKLTPLLRLKYTNSNSDALADLGQPEEIGMILAGFQKYLYQQAST